MLFVVDVEATGPIPVKYSMIEIGAVAILPDETFKTWTAVLPPVCEGYSKDALDAIGLSWEQVKTRATKNVFEIMNDFAGWAFGTSVQYDRAGRRTMMSDNIAFDWQWINYYLHTYVGNNPFGYSGRRIGDLYCGLKNDFYARWKHLRDTKHTHKALDDAIGNAEVLLKLKHDYKLNIRF